MHWVHQCELLFVFTCKRVADGSVMERANSGRRGYDVAAAGDAFIPPGEHTKVEIPAGIGV